MEPGFTYREDEFERQIAAELGIDYEELLLAEEAGKDDVVRNGSGNS